MSGLLAVSATGVTVMLVALAYQPLSDYAEYRVGSAPYAPITKAEPAYEPYVVEPLVDHPDVSRPWGYTAGYPYGYVAAEHVPGDDSVVLEFEDPAGTGQTHVQAYRPGQTFAYGCLDHDDGTEVRMYQYLGTSSFREELSLVLVRFGLVVPEDLPCDFPDYLKYTIDVYDSESLGPPRVRAQAAGAGSDYTTYTEPVGHAVIATVIFVDPTPVEYLYGPHASFSGAIKKMQLLQNGSIDVEFSDTWGNSTRAYVDNYLPGQTFVTSCEESDGVTFLYMHNYRGVITNDGSEYLGIVNFAAHTKVPVPCAYPDLLEHSTDALDMSWFDGIYEDRLSEWRRLVGNRSGGSVY